MANNYVHASFVIACDKESAELLINLLDREDADGYPRSFDAHFDATGVWITDDGEYIDADWVAQCIHEWLDERNVDDVVAFEVAYTCSKPRAGEFGGAVYVCTKKAWNALGTSHIMEQVRRDPENITRYFG